MNFIFNPNFIQLESALDKVLRNFRSEGTLIGTDKRNAIKYFDIGDLVINVKSFKKPGLLNKIVYRYFRKSKARRSFEYATILLQNGIGTPQPIAYLENKDWLGLNDSYYISEHLAIDFMCRAVIFDLNFPDREEIMRQYTRFFYDLQDKGIEFLDNTSGNTLIRKKDETTYEFFLVDLNRMNFNQKMDFHKRINNLSKLTTDKGVLHIISDEFAVLSGKKSIEVYSLLEQKSEDFQNHLKRKKRLKKVLKFWKKV